MQGKALIVDDEADIRELIQITLEKMGVSAVTVGNVADAKQVLQKERIAMCLTDMRMPGGDGMELLTYAQQYYPNIPIAVITAYGNMELAIQALKAGAFDFVSKPVNLSVLRRLVDASLQLSQLVDNTAQTTQRQLLGESQAMVDLRIMINKLARSQAPVLITGASGTGKELIAQLIHQCGPRANHPFVPVNCGAIPAELIESELFGYKKGSFTGAVHDHQGLFQAAHCGTLFLDEIAELPLALQSKLLRAIQEKSIRPIGSQKEVFIDVRILSATHKDLQKSVITGEFRQDLYYRINVIQLHAPSLEERPEDIPVLAEHILQTLAKTLHIKKPTLDKTALDKLRLYRFQGNVRELENILERSVTLSEKNELTAEDLHFDHEQTSVTTVNEHVSLLSYLDSVEKEAIQNALEKNNDDKQKTANQLGITLRALRYRMKKVGLS
jgi:two-component system, NtrC family, response regulator PilR